MTNKKKNPSINISYTMDQIKETLKTNPTWKTEYERMVAGFENQYNMVKRPEDTDEDPEYITFESVFGIGSFDEYFDKWFWDAYTDKVDTKYIVMQARLHDKKHRDQVGQVSEVIQEHMMPLYEAFVEEYYKQEDVQEEITEKDISVNDISIKDSSNDIIEAEVVEETKFEA